MRTIEIYFRKFLHIPPQNFTEKLMAAKELIVHIPLDESGKIKKILDRLNWIERNTHENLYISFYELDMWVNPTGAKDKAITFYISADAEKESSDYYEENRDGRRFSRLELGDYKVQKYLCLAIMEVQMLISQALSSSGLNFDETYMAKIRSKSEEAELDF